MPSDTTPTGTLRELAEAVWENANWFCNKCGFSGDAEGPGLHPNCYYLAVPYPDRASVVALTEAILSTPEQTTEGDVVVALTREEAAALINYSALCRVGWHGRMVEYDRHRDVGKTKLRAALSPDRSEGSDG